MYGELFSKLKIEIFYGEQFESVDRFIHTSKEHLWCYDDERKTLTLKRMSPVQYRTHSQF
ncbi:MAG: hypothetical protein E7352_00180 [Clostridiales bacterium]|nr:hypothetical protein [Clostridiales bacterium]MBE5746583.1 hypothetical protein [Clostridiales bacterium]